MERMGLGPACKKETSRMKNVLIESSGEKNCLWVEENCVFTEKFPNIYIYTSITIFIYKAHWCDIS
jgi:hypothetical protein